MDKAGHNTRRLTIEAMRINRYLALANQGSRRSCEDLIRAGRVQVDGETTTDLSCRVGSDSVVRVDGKIVYPDKQTIVYALNKPVRVLSSEADPQGRPLAIDYVRPLYSGHLFSIGRLDFLSSGLLLFTNDGDLAQRLMRPEAGIDRVYTVETAAPVPDEMLEQFTRGVVVEGIRYRCREYRRHAARRVSVILQEGKNREIRRVFAHFRIKVHRIYRVRYCSVSLGSLPEGEARPLTDEEVRRLQVLANRKAQRQKPKPQEKHLSPEKPSRMKTARQVIVRRKKIVHKSSSPGSAPRSSGRKSSRTGTPSQGGKTRYRRKDASHGSRD
ncbi:23S rRNA pseudouridine2605 synthase [Alkalispirochaeta americana]|uniref:Pseudouridine synthase n=1 Tax=Alkalispirochaeta americana TaxID=159291 RepID=A0A1N6P6S9_9SPIO|nr:pseudouridine synthase [Alkalispirochaeta americana]SIQ00094.1 23S rRNA pseudouridine2605 synthase [Alkalispirochaeta americana]